MRFMMLMLPGPKAEAGVVPDASMFEAMLAYNEALQKAGALLTLEGLHPTSRGARVSFKGGQPAVLPGPFGDPREVVGGFWIIEVGSMDEAIAWAARVPNSGDEIIEVRQVFDVTDFPHEDSDR